MDRHPICSDAESLNQSTVVKKEPRGKAKLSIYHLIYIPKPTYGHEIWDNRTRKRIQAVKMSFLQWVRSSITKEEHRVELLLHAKKSQLRHLFPLGGGPEKGLEHTGDTIFSQIVLKHPLDPPSTAGGSVCGLGSLSISAQTAASSVLTCSGRHKLANRYLLEEE